jgi:hypothetical protein
MERDQAKGIDYKPAAGSLREPAWLAENTGWGSHRATHPQTRGATLRGGLVRMPAAQRSPWHGSGGWPEFGEAFPPVGAGSLYFNVEGEVDFDAGGRSFRMAPLDILLINAVVYSYVNPGFSDVFFWTLHPLPVTSGEVDEDSGPPWDGDPDANMVGSHPYYACEPVPRPDTLDRISVVHWDDYRRGEIEWHGDWGSHWGAYPAVRTGLEGRMLRFPPGQRAQVRQVGSEVLLLGAGPGPVDVLVEESVYSVGSKDSLLIPEGVGFSCVNSGSSDRLLFEVARATAR